MQLHELRAERNALKKRIDEEVYAAKIAVEAEYAPQLNAIESQINRMENNKKGANAKRIKGIKHLMR